MKILVVEPQRYDPEARAVLERLGDVSWLEVAGQAELERALASAPWEALFVRLGVAVTPAALAAAPSLKWVVTPTTGLDHVDLPACAARGVRVLSLKGHTDFLDSITATAEHTWGLLLALLRRVPQAHGAVTDGGWVREPFLGNELAGRTLGLVGVGRLGRMVARYGLAFGMRVLVHDTSAESLRRAPAGVEPVSVETLLASSDVLSLHLPLEAATQGWLSRVRLQAMKPGAVLVNTARGELVDEAGLLEALQSGHLAGAAVDVLAGDSRWERAVPPEHPLVRYAATHDRLLITPHIGGYGRQSIARTRRFMIDRLAEALTQEPNR